MGIYLETSHSHKTYYAVAYIPFRKSPSILISLSVTAWQLSYWVQKNQTNYEKITQDCCIRNYKINCVQTLKSHSEKSHSVSQTST